MKKYFEFPKLPGSVTTWETSIMETVDPETNAGSSTRMILEEIETVVKELMEMGRW